MYIKVFGGTAVIISEEHDRPCSNPQGHDFNPNNGAMFGENGNCCSHCGHFAGGIEYFSAANGAAEAQAYARVMLGAAGPVEVREIEWKWGPGDVPKSPVMSATNALTTRLIAAAPDLLAALERLVYTLDCISLPSGEAWDSDLIAARADGWRTFRVSAYGDDSKLTGEIACPASAEAGKRTTCNKCRLCDGARPDDTRKSIVIQDHSKIKTRLYQIA